MRSPAFSANTIAEKTMPVARRLFFHSERSANSDIIDQSKGMVKPYANWRRISKDGS